jgi:hypothetical protein
MVVLYVALMAVLVYGIKQLAKARAKTWAGLEGRLFVCL